MNNTIRELVATIHTQFDTHKFDRFIHEITFPNFKKLKPFTTVTFRFPITILVGANGGGKSSILQALWGTPLGFSTNRFWFATQMDPIHDEVEGKANIPRYWYTHYVSELGARVQTRKVKGTKNNGYWEPSRPAVNDGMAKMPERTSSNQSFMSDSGDRWTPVKREPHYINTKSESSAFDRFFYHTAVSNLKDKQDFFIRRSACLHRALQNGLTTMNIGRGVFSIQQIAVSAKDLRVINRILGKNYKSAKKVVHDLFDRNKSPSVIFETAAHTYSESFAGSGELAIVNLVLKVETLNEFDLLLIDEPETSLHPGAQTALIEYLLAATKKKHLQVVIATHSPTILDCLPNAALVVLEETIEGTVVNLNATKGTAFHRLGQPDPNKVTIITEDRLLQAYVERALNHLPAEISSRVDVMPAVTGASEMLSHQVPAYMNAPSARVLMVLDGDQTSFMDLMAVEISSLSPAQLDEFVTKLQMECGVTIVGSTPDVVAYIRWCKRNVLVIDAVCPEHVFLQLLWANPPAHDLTNKESKQKVRAALKTRGDEFDSLSQYVIFKSKLGELAKDASGNGTAVLKNLKMFAARLEAAVNES